MWRSPACRSLRAIGSSADQPQGRALRRSGPGCCLWPPLVGRAVQACRRYQGGRDCLTSARVQGAGGPVGPEDHVAHACGWAAFLGVENVKLKRGIYGTKKLIFIFLSVF
jgi:hypothetical protein